MAQLHWCSGLAAVCVNDKGSADGSVPGWRYDDDNDTHDDDIFCGLEFVNSNESHASPAARACQPASYCRGDQRGGDFGHSAGCSLRC